MRRVALIESLASIGSAAQDARDRAAALRAAGCEVRVIVLDPLAPAAPPEPPPANGLARWSGPHAVPALRALVAAQPFDHVVIAAAAPAEGGIAAVVRGAANVLWWPTGLAAAPSWAARLTGTGRAVRAIGAPRSEAAAMTAAGRMEWCALDRERGARGRLALWDGDYVLAPVRPAGPAGLAALDAFAAQARERGGLDLVVLADPDPELERAARARGVGARVHAVGCAPRDAEWAWWMHAAAGLIAGREAMAGGLLLRALASGCPLLACGAHGPSAAAGGWLAAMECAPWQVAAADDPGAALGHLIGRDISVRAAIARGREVAARHDGAGWPARLQAAFAAADAVPARRAA